MIKTLFSLLSVYMTVAVGLTECRAQEQHVPVQISGGYETDPQDHGRPVILVAHALGVAPEVFREAFSHVRPAGGNESPTDDRVHANKEELLSRLSPLGITNERLDEVSDYYRYHPGSGELWKHETAEAYAVIINGQIQSIVISHPGAGYSSPPAITIPGYTSESWVATVFYCQDLSRNGSLAIISRAVH